MASALGGSIVLSSNPEFKEWKERGKEARDYLSRVRPDFKIRDDNANFSFMLRHGLINAPVPPSHSEIVPETATSTKRYNEILNRLVSILTAAYPTWIWHPDSLSTASALRASRMGTFARSLWLAAEDRNGIPLIRQLMDQQLAMGGAFVKIQFRLDRWKNLPFREPDESDRDFKLRVNNFKTDQPLFDISVPEYNHIYYDNTTDGITRLAESRRITVYEAADIFGGNYDEKQKTLRIPVQVLSFDRDGRPKFEQDEEGNDIGEQFTESHTIEIKSSREVNYLEYWRRDPMGGPTDVVYMIEDWPVRVDHFHNEMPIPYFLAIGEITSSPDPGRMGLPILYNVFEAFVRLLGLIGMEYSFLWKHGFARVLRIRRRQDNPATVEPDLPDQEEEEEVIGEVIDMEIGEDFRYVTPANVSVLFADAKADVLKEIDDAGMADIMTGKTPPSGTTGFLMSQIATAAVSKYVPLLHQVARALRKGTLYMVQMIDNEVESDVTVAAQQNEPQQAPFVTYKPKEGRGNRNLEIVIDAPLPSDQIGKTQWLALGHKGGYLSRERVQREGYRIEQPGLEDEKIRIERFRQFYEPIAQLRAMKRAGQMDQVLEAARAGLLPPALEQLALAFAAGPDNASPTANPNQIISPRPGLGEPAVPTTGASSNAGFGMRGRAAGGDRRPGNQPENPTVVDPESPV